MRHPPPGVDTDLEESQEVVKFAKQLEILNKGEAGNLKARPLRRRWDVPLCRVTGAACKKVGRRCSP